MTYDEEERKIARDLAKSKPVMDFLIKFLLSDDNTFGDELNKNVAALDDAEYGRLMKVVYLCREHNKSKLKDLQRIGAGGERTPGSVAPK